MSSKRLPLLIVSALLVLEAPARAEPPAELSYDLALDGAITLGSGAAWLSAIAARESIGPATCHWCTTNSFDLSARSALVWGNPMAAETLVSVVGFAVAPAVTVGADVLAAEHDGALKDGLVDALLITEAAGIASDVNLALRFAVGRQRPWAWAASQSSGGSTAGLNRDSNMSFFSGHSTMMFAVSTAAGTIAEMRGYRWSPLVWLVGMPFAVAVAYLRVASDDHWMSDVLVGTAAGGAMGFAIPYFAHRPGVRVVAWAGTVAVVGSF